AEADEATLARLARGLRRAGRIGNRPEPSLERLLEHEVRLREQFAALLTVSRAVTSSLDLDRILATIARQVRQVIHVDECTVFLLDAAGEWLEPVVANVSSHEAEVKRCRLRLGEGITGSVARSGRGEIVND